MNPSFYCHHSRTYLSWTDRKPERERRKSYSFSVKSRFEEMTMTSTIVMIYRNLLIYLVDVTPDFIRFCFPLSLSISVCLKIRLVLARSSWHRERSNIRHYRVTVKSVGGLLKFGIIARWIFIRFNGRAGWMDG